MGKMSTGHGVSENEKGFVGKGDFAGMPSQVKMEAWPKSRLSSGKELNDTISGIDEVNNRSESKRSKYVSSQH